MSGGDEAAPPHATPRPTGGAGAPAVPHTPGRLRGALMVLLAACLWATIGIFGREAYQHGAQPLEAASARAALAFVGLGLLNAWRPRRLAVPLSELPFFALFGTVSIAAFYYLYFAALERVPVGVAAALLYTAPVFAVLLARALFGEALTAWKLGALAAAVAGVVLVSGALGSAPSPDGARAAAGGTRTAGILLGLGSGLTYALFTLFGRRSGTRHDAVRTVFWAMGFGALVLGLLVPPWRVLVDHPGAIPWILALSLVSTLGANLLYMGALRHVEAGVAAVLATIEPVVAGLLAWLWLGEGLAGGQIAGLVLVVAAAGALMSRPARAAGAAAGG
ncbi:MAG TPA: EamA family transporter [Longimicrobiales bacterium]|nr:EamA family transporter [Longimicrobiales bacterium]